MKKQLIALLMVASLSLLTGCWDCCKKNEQQTENTAAETTTTENADVAKELAMDEVVATELVDAEAAAMPTE